MKRSTVIWSCPACDHWHWGSLYDPPDTCPDCHADLTDVQPDRAGAVDTYYCMRFHERREDLDT